MEPISSANAQRSLIRYCPSFLPAIITSAKGSYVYTQEGKRILDFTSGQMSSILGHGNPEIVSVIAKHAADLDHLFSGMLSPPVINMANKLADMLPSGLDKVQLLSTGGESNECAIRIAKLYTSKFEIVGLANSWHGVTFGASSLTYQPGTRKGYGPSAPGSLILPSPNAFRSPFRKQDNSYDWDAELTYAWGLIDTQSVGSLAAVIIEPILSSGGVIVLPDGYLKKMKEHCVKRGMLLIVDEAQTGVGRTGKNWAFEHHDVVPDILTLSKTLGAGLPLSAVVTSTEIEQRVYDLGFSFFTTHVSDPMPAAVGIQVLEMLERDHLAARAKKLGDIFQAFLRDLQGMEIVKPGPLREPDDELGTKLADRMLELGLSANVVRMPGTSSCFRMAPPLTVSENELFEGLNIIEEAFRSTIT